MPRAWSNYPPKAGRRRCERADKRMPQTIISALNYCSEIKNTASDAWRASPSIFSACAVYQKYTAFIVFSAVSALNYNTTIKMPVF
jgi:hypothetical protein